MNIFCDNDKCRDNFYSFVSEKNGCDRPGINIKNGRCISFRKKETKKKSKKIPKGLLLPMR